MVVSVLPIAGRRPDGTWISGDEEIGAYYLVGHYQGKDTGSLAVNPLMFDLVIPRHLCTR